MIFKLIKLIFDLICNIIAIVVLLCLSVLLLLFFSLNAIWNYLQFKKPGQMVIDLLISSGICFYMANDIFWLPFVKGVVHTTCPIKTTLFIKRGSSPLTDDPLQLTEPVPTYFFLRKKDFAFYKLQFNDDPDYKFHTFNANNVFWHLKDSINSQIR